MSAAPYLIVIDPTPMGMRRPVRPLHMRDDEIALAYRDAIDALEDVVTEVRRRQRAMLALGTTVWRLVPGVRAWKVSVAPGALDVTDQELRPARNRVAQLLAWVERHGDRIGVAVEHERAWEVAA